MSKPKSVAIVGGGASGLCAAAQVKYSSPETDVTVFERLPKIAKKILATGNGRCNFANEDLAPKHFYGDTSFLRAVLTSPYADTENHFRSLGVLSHHEDGRIYPRSQQALTIQKALIDEMSNFNVKIRTDTPVTNIEKFKTGFLVNCEYFDAVVVSGGGKASPVHGSNGSCYNLLKSLGHSLTPIYPALCGLVTDEKDLNSLKGVRAQCSVSLYYRNSLLGEEIGEVQFNDKSISGIPVMNLSHLCADKNGLYAVLDFCPEFDKTELKEHINLIKRTTPKKELADVLCGIVNFKIGVVLAKRLKIDSHTTLGNISREKVEIICDTLKSFNVKIRGTKGFENAQITRGGIKTDEVNPKNMMSEKLPGLFICGEILDIHGDCGGYNLHLAWTTGRIAGNGVSKYLKTEGSNK